MKTIGSVFVSETRRFFSFRNGVILLALFTVSFYFVHREKCDYKLMLSGCQTFLEAESAAFEHLRNYTQYSKNGIQVLYIPAASSIFFSTPAVMNELTARVNSVIRVDIYSNSKRKLAGKDDYPFNLSFSVVILLLGGPLVMLLGFPISRNKEYFAYLYSICKCSHRFLFISIFLARVVLVSFCFLALFGILLAILVADGILFTAADYFGLMNYAWITVLVLTVFLALGAIIGKVDTEKKGFALIAVMSVVILIGLPILTNVAVDEMSADVTSTYRIFKDKLKIVTDFERRMEKEYGRFDRKKIELFRRLIELYKRVEYPRIESLENRIREDIAANVQTYNRISVLNPISFYLQTCLAVSSCAYDNAVSFYAYVQRLKWEFHKHIVKQTYYNDHTVLVNFLTGEQNIFRAATLLPPNFRWGVLMLLFFNALLFVTALLLFDRAMFPVLKNPEAFVNVNMHFFPGNHTIVKAFKTEFIDQILNVFFGKSSRFPGVMTLDDKGIVNWQKKDVVYLPNPDKLPGDIKVKDFIFFLQGLLGLSGSQVESLKGALSREVLKKPFRKVSSGVKAMLLLRTAQLRPFQAYFLHNITKGTECDYESEVGKITDQLIEKGAVIIDAIQDNHVWKSPDIGFTFRYRENLYHQEKIINS